MFIGMYGVLHACHIITYAHVRRMQRVIRAQNNGHNN